MNRKREDEKNLRWLEARRMEHWSPTGWVTIASENAAWSHVLWEFLLFLLSRASSGFARYCQKPYTSADKISNPMIIVSSMVRRELARTLFHYFHAKDFDFSTYFAYAGLCHLSKYFFFLFWLFELPDLINFLEIWFTSTIVHFLLLHFSFG